MNPQRAHQVREGARPVPVPGRTHMGPPRPRHTATSHSFSTPHPALLGSGTPSLATPVLGPALEPGSWGTGPGSLPPQREVFLFLGRVLGFLPTAPPPPTVTASYTATFSRSPHLEAPTLRPSD